MFYTHNSFKNFGNNFIMGSDGKPKKTKPFLIGWEV